LHLLVTKCVLEVDCDGDGDDHMCIAVRLMADISVSPQRLIRLDEALGLGIQWLLCIVR